MPVTTIKLEGTLASKNNMSDLMAKSIEKFESMLRAENCQVINVNMGKREELCSVVSRLLLLYGWVLQPESSSLIQLGLIMGFLEWYP